jgi:ribonuclease E
MAALHGRDDPLLDPTRFARLLRQANDAEIADVRKVGEDDYEISPHRTAALVTPSAPAAPRSEAPATPAEPEAPAEPAGAAGGGGRDNGSRFGVRFRRGSRGSSRPGEIPLIGVVQMEVPPDEPQAPESSVAVEAEEAPVKKPRARRAPRKKAAAPAGTAEPDEPEAAAPAKRPRARAKKKVE